MPPEAIIDDEEYASSEDSDFAPENVPEQDGAESSDGDDDDVVATKPAAPPAKKRKQAGGHDDAAAAAAEDAGFENSGDEAIIEKGKKRQKKKGGRKAQLEQDDDDEGGEGGLIKTRSMRAVEKAERKAQPVAGPVTVDVDALWASMTAAPILPTPPTTAAPPPGSQQEQGGAGRDHPTQQTSSGKTTETIKIKRTYNFAGKVHTEEKLVARDSAEARLYLASQKHGGGHADDAEAAEGDDDQQAADKRMPRKAFRSAYEPVLLTGEDGRADLNLGIAVRLQARAADKARKLNTVEKSRMDWAGFVDKEGIKDELVLAGRAKGNFSGQQDFLARTEARREDDARRVRLAGKAS